VLQDGAIVEYAPVQAVIEQPQHAYTRQLISAAHIMPDTLPEPRTMPPGTSASKPLLQVSAVTAGYGRQQKFIALENVSLNMYEGRTIGVIGESGSGKTTLGRVISGLMPPKSGEVELLGRQLAGSIDQREKMSLRHIQFAFQMADVALNPKHRIGRILGRPLQFYFDMPAKAREERVRELLGLVELPAEFADRYPRQLSGGEKQRVNLARALAAEPKLIICDEITSALDTIVAKAILVLLKNLQAKLGISYLFISHDLSTIANMADTIAVMREGKVMEVGTTTEIMTPPHHPYTMLLLNSVPEMRTDWLESPEL